MNTRRLTITLAGLVGFAAGMYKSFSVGNHYSNFGIQPGSGDYNEEKKHNFKAITKGGKKNKKLLRAQRGW